MMLRIYRDLIFKIKYIELSKEVMEVRLIFTLVEKEGKTKITVVCLSDEENASS